MKEKIVISLGMILLVSGIAGCQNDSLNASNSLSKNEEIPVVENAGEADVNPGADCSAIDPHPVAEGMTEKFEITYDEVMTLYCDGYAFSDILLALETSEIVAEEPAALLARLRTRTWQEIWDEYGVNPQ